MVALARRQSSPPSSSSSAVAVAFGALVLACTALAQVSDAAGTVMSSASAAAASAMSAASAAAATVSNGASAGGTASAGTSVAATATAPSTPAANDTSSAANTPPRLTFSLFLTPRSPILQFTEAKDRLSDYNLTDWQIIVNGSEVIPGTGAKVLDGPLTHKLGPRPREIVTRLEFPMVGTSLRIEGSYNSNYTRFLWYNSGKTAAKMVPPPFGPILVDDSLDYTEFGRREPWMHTGGAGDDKGTVEIANVTINTAMRSNA